MLRSRRARKWALVTLLALIFGLCGLPAPYNVATMTLKYLKGVLPFLPQDPLRADQIIDGWGLAFTILGAFCLLLAIAIVFGEISDRAVAETIEDERAQNGNSRRFRSDYPRSVASRCDATAIAISKDTGLRPMELMNLKLRNTDLQNGSVNCLKIEKLDFKRLLNRENGFKCQNKQL